MTLVDFFIAGIILGLVGVLESRQTIYSLLWLVFTFICSAMFFVSMEMNLLGLLFIIVYIGAIAMLFLYMIMLIDPVYSSSAKSLYEFGAIFVGIGIFMLIPQNYDTLLNLVDNNGGWIEQNFLSSDISVMAVSLYTQYGWAVILVGFLLFEAMLVAIDIARFSTNKVSM